MSVIDKKLLPILVKSILDNTEYPLDVVYDVDDVLNDLNEQVFKRIGGTWRPNRFNIRECAGVTEELAEKVLKSYQDPELFKVVNWVPGYKDITKIEETNRARVWINSNSFNNDIRNIKAYRISNELSEVNPDRVVLQVSGTEGKQAIRASIVIEDHIANCLKYADWAVKILVDKTWNSAIEYGIDEEDNYIIRVNSLVEANEAVREIITYRF